MCIPDRAERDVEHEEEERELNGEGGIEAVGDNPTALREEVGERRGDEEEVIGSTGSTGPLCSLSVGTGQEVIEQSEEGSTPSLEVALETRLGSTVQREEAGRDVDEDTL